MARNDGCPPIIGSLWSKLTFHQGLEWHHGVIGVDRAMAEAAKKIELDPSPEDRALARALLWRRGLIWSSIILMLFVALAMVWITI